MKIQINRLKAGRETFSWSLFRGGAEVLFSRDFESQPACQHEAREFAIMLKADMEEEPVNCPR